MWPPQLRRSYHAALRAEKERIMNRDRLELTKAALMGLASSGRGQGGEDADQVAALAVRLADAALARLQRPAKAPAGGPVRIDE